MRFLFILSLVLLPLFSFAQNRYETGTDMRPAYQDNRSDQWVQNFILESSLSIDFLFRDFSPFIPDLGSYNTDIMNQNDASIIFGLGGYYKRYYASLMFGFAFEDKKYKDSLDITFNTTVSGIGLGFKLIDSKRVSLKPGMDLKWYRYRLLNSDSEKKIPLSQYMSEREVDLRFNQFIWVPGLDLDLKFYRYSPYPIPGRYWSVGIFAGYPIKINSKPLVYSKGSRLTTESHIGIKNLNISVNFRFYF